MARDLEIFWDKADEYAMDPVAYRAAVPILTNRPASGSARTHQVSTVRPGNRRSAAPPATAPPAPRIGRSEEEGVLPLPQHGPPGEELPSGAQAGRPQGSLSEEGSN